MGMETETEVRNACACTVCVGMCARPGWPTPEEAMQLMDAGLAARMMLDFWVGDVEIPVVCPANPGYESSRAWEPEGFGDLFDLLGGGGSAPLVSGCTFLKDGLCEIHASGAKPLECRTGHHATKPPDGYHESVAKLWETDEGLVAVSRWKDEAGYH